MSLREHEVSAQIIESCQRGDRVAFRVLYEAYKDRVYSVSLYFFHGDSATASDVTQQVFLKLMTNIGQFRGDSGFSTWLHRLVVNACMDNARGKSSRELSATQQALERIPQQASHESELFRTQAASSVQSALSSLPPKLRMPLLMRYFEDLSYQEMAQALNCSMGTVASRLSRAHKALAVKLEFLRG